ncbi:MAG: patatin-like phospholipase family protein [Symploca sp. SIO3E6]|nr:patatin-like phospholipase family protein [Caldora sp. SIO3E6]
MNKDPKATTKTPPNIALLLGGVFLVALPIALFHQYIYYLRVPILGILFLVFLPLISRSSMLRNLFIFDNKWQLFFVIAAVPIAGLAIANTLEAILAEAPTRFSFNPPWGWEWIRSILSYEITLSHFNQLQLDVKPVKEIFALLLASLTCITAINRSRKDSELSKYVNSDNQPINNKPGAWLFPGVLIGILLALLFSILVNIATTLVTDYVVQYEPNGGQQLVNIIKILPQEGEQSYLINNSDYNSGLKGYHLSNLGFFLVVLFFYIVNYFWGLYLIRRPQPINGKTKEKFYIPALFYLMLITTGLILLFGSLTFLLDYYLVPVLLTFLIFSALMYRLFDVDHYYRLKPNPSNKPILIDEKQAIADFKQALQQRLQYQGEENRTLVVVCASGGGIQAAGWIVQVLTGLQQALDEIKPGFGTKFIKAIGMISSVSGSSVGTMYYLDRFQKDGYPPEAEFKKIFNSTTANSLDATGWGLAYPDFLRFVGFPWIPNILGSGDRGTAIETDWQGNLNNKTLSLNTWRTQALAGTIPIPVFNATFVDNGYRFLISPMTFIKPSNDQKYWDFNRLYGKDNYDIDVTTAARLSATFPYVTPICRNLYPDNLQEKKHDYHVADGGYFDNFGVFTTVEWLDKVVLNNIDDLKLQKVIILQINAFPPSASTSNNSITKRGWLMSLAGPLLATVKVRNSTQTDRNDLEIQVLQEKWEQLVEIEHIKVDPPKIEYSDFGNNNKSQSLKKSLKNYWKLFVNSRGQYNPPLSWKLSEFEKEMIKLAWEKIKDDVAGKIERKL